MNYLLVQKLDGEWKLILKLKSLALANAVLSVIRCDELYKSSIFRIEDSNDAIIITSSELKL